eukprot:SAG11_NODE_16244_length_553_cov_1.099119_2_plen_22_part_01
MPLTKVPYFKTRITSSRILVLV